MRDPATHIDPEVEAAIEEICRLLETYMDSKSWKADPDPTAFSMRCSIRDVEESDMPDYVKRRAALAMLEQAKKRRKKPTRHYRDMAVQLVAVRLEALGYTLTRNEATRHRASASSIISKALRRLGEPTSEKQVNAILGKGRKYDIIRGKDGEISVCPSFSVADVLKDVLKKVAD